MPLKSTANVLKLWHVSGWNALTMTQKKRAKRGYTYKTSDRVVVENYNLMFVIIFCFWYSDRNPEGFFW